MTAWCKKIVLVLALAVMPLQGIASTLSVLFCHGAHAHSLHDQDGHEHGANDGGHQDEGGTAVNHADHAGCHYNFSTPPAVTLPAAPPDFPVRAFAPDALHDLFVPELPHRPPLA